FEINAPAPREPRRKPAQRVGRNDPCPCGSGKKYKKCHEGTPIPDEPAGLAPTVVDVRAAPRVAPPSPDRLERDHHLVPKLHRFAAERFGSNWMRDAARDFADYDATAQLSGPWAFYMVPIEGRTIGEWYRNRHERDLASADRRWLAAQAAAWLSVWEVIGVVRGESIELHDLLSGERRQVLERAGSQTIERGITMLARIVDYDGHSLICGVHPNVLPPREGAAVVESARGRLRRRREVPIERLRDIELARYLIRRWEKAVHELEQQAAHPPSLQNSEGDLILPTCDRFKFERSARREIERRIAALEGVEKSGGGPAASTRFDVLRPTPGARRSLEQLLLGQITVEAATLRIDTNSRARADALLARIEAACGPLIQHRSRDHTDPMSAPNQARPARAPSFPDVPPPEVTQLLLDLKRRHYREWVDLPVPALDDKTPREMARTKRGRERIAVLIKDMEFHERQLDPGLAFDFDWIRRELGIDA
ncbi:SEC-C domain-containing protein, partial [Myxococcota bacterium]|nr:SEC-C domain-containing protein [Myxococcota bacterium]